MITPDAECIICMDRYAVTDERLACFHSNNFCKQCLDSCIRYNLMECPLCKTTMNHIPIVFNNTQIILPDQYGHGIVIHIRPDRTQRRREVSEFTAFVLLTFSFFIFLRFMIYPIIYHIYELEIHAFH